MRLHTLRNANGVEVQVLDLGATITSIKVPDRAGQLDDVVLGYATADAYRNNPACLGSLVGRFAGRIAGASFPLDGEYYRVSKNHGDHHIHGGRKGFDAMQWRFASDASASSIRLTATSEDGDQGFPGTLSVDVRYTLDDDNALKIAYRATTDRPTVINLTNHSYFNLGGHASGSVLDHSLRVDADSYLPVDEDAIPLGTLEPVAGSELDFREQTPLADRRLPDHTLVVNPVATETPRHVARLSHAGTGRVLDVLTTEPGVQVFVPETLAHLEGLKDGARYERTPGICLETQHFPNAPNEPAFPTTRLNPGEVFASTTIYRFSVDA